jgi:hypothetical protein
MKKASKYRAELFALKSMALLHTLNDSPRGTRQPWSMLHTALKMSKPHQTKSKDLTEVKVGGLFIQLSFIKIMPPPQKSNV